jgi:hypothetical protein
VAFGMPSCRQLNEEPRANEAPRRTKKGTVRIVMVSKTDRPRRERRPKFSREVLRTIGDVVRTLVVLLALLRELL